MLKKASLGIFTALLALAALFPAPALSQHMWMSLGNRLAKVDYNGQVVDTSRTYSGAVTYRVAQDGNGNAWVVKRDGYVVRVLASGVVGCTYPGPGTYYGVAAAQDGSAWVTDVLNDRIQHVSATCTNLGTIPTPNDPRDLIITPDQEIFVVNNLGPRMLTEVSSGGTVVGQYPICPGHTAVFAMAASNGPGGMLDNRFHVACGGSTYSIETYDRSGNLLNDFVSPYARGLQSNPRFNWAIGAKAYAAPIRYYLFEQYGTVLCKRDLTGDAQTYGVTYGLDGAHWLSAGSSLHRFFDPVDQCASPQTFDLGVTLGDYGNYGDAAGFQWFIGPGAMLDSDGDLLTNHDEAAKFFTFPNNPDSDGEGLDDRDEVCYDGDCDHLTAGQDTDPWDPDTDDDGMDDAWEAAYDSCLDPLAGDSLADPDLDGDSNMVEYGNSTDPCVAHDADGDGMPDYWEDLYACVDMMVGDSLQNGDADTLLNLAEYMAGTNPCNSDTDNDGMDDAWEVSYSYCGVQPAVGDSLADPDVDGVSNLAEYGASSDPCVAPDADGDGMSDYWEDLYACVDSMVGDSLSDADGDTLTNLEEFQALTNPCDPDTDSDTMPDAWEVYYSYCGVDPLVGDTLEDNDLDELSNLAEWNLGTDPCDLDTDGDLMDDGWEVQNACLDPLFPEGLSDGDTDGLLNIQEYSAGTDPCDEDSDDDGATDLEEVSYDGEVDYDPLFDPDPNDPDTDGDGFTDGVELGYAQDFPCMGTGDCAAQTGCVVSSYNGHNYLRCETTMTWANARNFCLDFGGNLTAVGDLGEHYFLTAQLNPTYYWMGLNDLKSEGVYVWSSGAPANYFMWAVDEPNNFGGNEDCVDFHPGKSFNWNDNNCANNERFACEDNFPLSPTNPDTDGDGLDDWTEVYLTLTNPFDPDTDRDGLEDGEEVWTWGTDPLDTDTDDDGFSDYAEVITYGSDPLNPDGFTTYVQAGPEKRVSYNSSSSYNPSLAWTGTVYGLSWYDYRDGNHEIYAGRVAEAGDTVVSESRISFAAGISRYPSLVWTGSEYGVAYEDYRPSNEIYFARFTASGDTVLSEMRITNDAAYSNDPSLVWTGSEYAVAWEDYRDGNYEIYLARIAATGDTVFSEFRITKNAGISRNASLARTSTGEFAVAWEESRDGNYEIYLARLPAAGDTVSSEFRVTNDAAASSYPSLVWRSNEYAVAWHDNREGNYEIYLARVNSTGSSVLSETRVTTDGGISEDASVVWTGAEYAVAWEDDRHGSDEIYFARVSTAGVKSGFDARITRDPSSSYNPSLVWSTGEYGVAWCDQRDGNFEIYFTRIGLDTDGDMLANLDEPAWGTDSNDWDTDDDGMPDGWEVIYNSCGLNPLAGDSLDDDDTDSLTNLYEYQIGSDPCNPDTDGDGMTDGWENQHACVNILADDDAANPDADGITNMTEYTIGTDPCNPDTDGDSMPDGWENQYACVDPLVGDSAADPDLDLLTSLQENGIGTNPCLADTDDDGLEDGYEVLTSGTDPLNPDTDDDGLSDNEEPNVSFTDPLDPDSDADGAKDGYEYYGGSNPNDDRIVPGLPMPGSEIRETFDSAYQRMPSLAFTGSEYGLAWHQRVISEDEILFERLSSGGTVMGGPVQVSSASGDNTDAALTWSGSDFGLTWGNYHQIVFSPYYNICFTRITAAGAPMAPELNLTNSAANDWTGEPEAVWTGSEYALSWWDDRTGRQQVYMARVTDGGTQILPNSRITYISSNTRTNSLAWTGSEFGLAWEDERYGSSGEIFFEGVTAAGTIIGPDQRISFNNNNSYNPSIAWTGRGFGVSWEDHRDNNYEIYLALLSEEGAPTSPELRISAGGGDSMYSSIAWAENAYGIAWEDLRTGPAEIYFALVSLTGEKLTADVRITNKPSDSQQPDLIWTGSEFGLAWEDNYYTADDIYGSSG